MRTTYKELMDKLGIENELLPYETKPWFLYDEEKAITCIAEVRVGPETQDVEAEIQFLYEENDDDDDSESGGEGDSGEFQIKQILLMHFEPSKDQVWVEKSMFVKGENYNNKIHNWGERGCDFFVSCIGALQMGELPEIDEMIEKDLTDSESGGRGKRGRVGKKGLKMQNQPPPMGMKA